MNEHAGELLGRGRGLAESLMTLTLAVFEPTGDMVTGDGGYEGPSFTDKTSTIGKVQGSSTQAGDPAARTVTIGGVGRLVLVGGLHIPISAQVPVAGLVRGAGWEYAVTAVGTDDDPALLNRRYLVINAPVKSYATVRRLDVVEV